MDSKKFDEFIDRCLCFGGGKMFTSKPSKECKTLKTLTKQFKIALIELRECQLGSIGQMNCQLYEAIVYKFGPSNRHQKFWRMALRAYKMLRKLNEQDIIGPFSKFSQRLEKSGCVYQPTKKAFCYLAAVLIRRLSQLDKLLFLSGRSADSSMGYIELHHMLTFNLMSVAMLSEIASQALRQMKQLTNIYLELSIWFRKCSKRFPSTIDEIQCILFHQIDDSTKDVNRFLQKEHDLAILRQEIGGAEKANHDASQNSDPFAKTTRMRRRN